jgi:hypothetical protein
MNERCVRRRFRRDYAVWGIDVRRKELDREGEDKETREREGQSAERARKTKDGSKDRLRIYIRGCPLGCNLAEKQKRANETKR